MGQNKFPYKRTIVFGFTGIGKTTLVKCIAEDFDLPVISIDALRREAGRSDSPEETFSRLVTESVKADSWIMDGSYTSVQGIVWPRTEAIIWLDYPFWIAIPRLIRRCIYRIFIRKNSEKPIKGKSQPASERSLTYLQAILNGGQRRQGYFATLYDSHNAHLHIIHLCSPQDAKLWLDHLKNKSTDNTTSRPFRKISIRL